jgi:hypothetical protein
MIIVCLIIDSYLKPFEPNHSLSDCYYLVSTIVYHGF